MNSISISTSTNDNYVNYLLALIASILENTPNTKIIFFVVYQNLSNESISLIKNKFADKVEFNFLKIDKNLFIKANIEAYYKVSYEAYTRILIPTILTEVEKTIYLDPDIVCIKNLNDLFNVEISDYEIAAVKDFNPNSVNIFKNTFDIKNCNSYFNSGVMLMNLKKLRETDFTSKALKLINKSNKKYKFFDQDLLNYFFCDSYLKIDPRWNTQLYLELVTSNYKHSTLSKDDYENCIRDPYIIHYTIVKPDKLNYFFKNRDLYKKYLLKSNTAFKIKKTSPKEIIWTLFEIVFFKFINKFSFELRDKILEKTRNLIDRYYPLFRKMV